MWRENEPSRVSPLDVIDTAYGSIVSERLQSLCHREGFKAATREPPLEFKLSVLSIHKMLMALYTQITMKIRAWLKVRV
jgi:hypothetical protein